jgi:RHS repeat-associated protein
VLARCHETPEETPWGCLSWGAGPVQVSIDPNGNLASKVDGADTWGYEWNAHSELTRVTKNGVEQARFVYDPFGRRVEKVAGGVTTSYTYDGTSILREARGSAILKYVHGPGIDEPLAREDGSGALNYYHADGLGSIAKRTNQTGALVHEYRYDVWGNIETGASEPGFSYTSREWDPEIGLTYYRARYYEPKLGRFISEDPIGLGGGDPNLYAYVRNSPAKYTDPSGELVWTPALVWWMAQAAAPYAAAGGAAAAAWAWAWWESQQSVPSDPSEGPSHPRDPDPGVPPRVNPGRDCATGNCKPCPPIGVGPWQAPGNDHGSTTGTHWHWFEWNQNPKTCECFLKRGSGPSRPSW